MEFAHSFQVYEGFSPAALFLPQSKSMYVCNTIRYKAGKLIEDNERMDGFIVHVSLV